MKQDAWTAFKRFGHAHDGWQNSGGEVFEAGVGISQMRRRVEAQEGLLDAVGERLDEAGGIVWRVFESSTNVAHVLVVQGVDLGGEECGKDDCLPHVLRIVVEIP
jgi:hypothetical protein